MYEVWAAAAASFPPNNSTHIRCLGFFGSAIVLSQAGWEEREVTILGHEQQLVT